MTSPEETKHLTDRDTLKRLRHVGRKLLKCQPSAADNLLELLDKLELILSRVDQTPTDHVQESLVPSMKALISAELMRHPDEDVKISVTSCLTEITRITAPEAPYDDEEMKEVFKLTVAAFEKLSHVSGRGYEKALTILDNVWKVRSSLVMLDLECDDLVIEMFQHFLSVIRSNHPSNAIHSMESIMILVLNESEEISPALLRPLLDSARKENQTIAPISWILAEKVITECAVKLRPFLMKAVESSGRALEEYPQVVTSICRNQSESLQFDHSLGSPKTVVQTVDNKLDESKDADERPCDVTKGLEPDITCVRDSQITDHTKSNIRSASAGATTVDGGEAINKSGTKRKQHSDLTKNSKRSNAKSHSETCNLESVLELNSENLPRRRGRKPNSLMNAEEGYDHSWVQMGTKTGKSAESRKAHNPSSVFPPSKNPITRKDMLHTKPKTKHEALAPEPKHENIAKPAQLRKTHDIGSDFLPSENPASSKDNVLSKSADMSKGIKESFAKPKNDQNTDATPRSIHNKDGSCSKRGRPRKINPGNQDVHTNSVSILKEDNLNPLLDKALLESPIKESVAKPKNDEITDATSRSIHKSCSKRGRPRKITSTGNQDVHTNSVSILKEENLNPLLDKTLLESHDVALEKESDVKPQPHIRKIKFSLKFNGRTVVAPEVLCEDEGRHKSPMDIEIENREEGRSSGQTEVKKRRRCGATPNRGLNKSSAVKGQISESASKALSGVEETTQAGLRRRNITTSAEASESPDLCSSLVGHRIKVWWPMDKTFYEGVVNSYDPVKRKHKIVYEDGDEEVLYLKKQRWALVEDDVSPNEEEGLGLQKLAEATDIAEKCIETSDLESAKGAKTNSQSRKDSAGKPPRTRRRKTGSDMKKIKLETDDLEQDQAQRA